MKSNRVTMIAFAVLILLAWEIMPKSMAKRLGASVSNIFSVTPPFGLFAETINGETFRFARIPAGSFVMGNDRSPYPEEKPAHRVQIKSFYLGQFEITRGQWNAVAQGLPRVDRDLNAVIINNDVPKERPITAIFWVDMIEFCKRLTRATGKTHRLPSEAEWEYACRAGTQTEYWFGDEVRYDLENLRSGPEPNTLKPVGAMGATNPWGLFDMHGNASEICLDVWHPNYFGAPTDGSAWLSGSDDNRIVIRGGDYLIRVELARSFARRSTDKRLRTGVDGFRVVVEHIATATGQIAIASAASYDRDSLSPGALMTVFGQQFATTTEVAKALPLPVSLANTSVVIKDRAGAELLCSLFFVSPTQINCQLPAALTLGTATVTVVSSNGNLATSAVEMKVVSPGLFSANATGQGMAAALALRIKANGEQHYEPIATYDAALNRFVPIPLDLSNSSEQVYLVLFGTGFRQRTSLANVSATVGGLPVDVLYAGAQGDLVGVDQANLRLPLSLAGRGEMEVQLTVDGQLSNRVQIRIK